MKTRLSRQILAAVKQAVPDADVTLGHGGKHPCIVMEKSGRRIRVPFSGSPRDAVEHVLENCTRQAVRRWREYR
jgi:hypothetical protein